LLAPQVAPTAQAQRPACSQGVYATQWTGSYLPELWYRYMTETDNYHGGTTTRWIAALSAATCNIKVKCYPIAGKEVFAYNRKPDFHELVILV